eukprot:TRINITY_DN82405_c0_g1_i1.p1 TRINITY_DN82405_c0_g1~~TRINITY_DN82405_c0_g1_i1.p1  ORF type:complete len:109 (-),score=6.70 TRINITY_DN82405_c0_g1_i1:4-330(-)
MLDLWKVVKTQALLQFGFQDCMNRLRPWCKHSFGMTWRDVGLCKRSYGDLMSTKGVAGPSRVPVANAWRSRSCRYCNRRCCSCCFEMSDKRCHAGQAARAAPVAAATL